MSIDYNAIGAAIVTHLQSKLSSTTYFVTQSFSHALNQTVAPVGVCVLFMGFAHREELSQTVTPTRDARYTIGVTARGESDDKIDERLDDAVSEIEDACNLTGHGFPVFDYSTTLLERAIVTGAGPKSLTDKGLTTTLDLEIRIMEA